MNLQLQPDTFENAINIDIKTIISEIEEKQAFSHIMELAEKEIDSSTFSKLTDDEKIVIAAARVLKRFKPAFIELAK